MKFKLPSRCGDLQERRRRMAESKSDYEVGPGRPPLHTRLKKG
jgi:hypothetical protein